MHLKLIEKQEREWLIQDDQGKTYGEVSRKQTGYLVRREGMEAVKRFRLIDALNESFGPGHTFDLPDATKPTEEGYV